MSDRHARPAGLRLKLPFEAASAGAARSAFECWIPEDQRAVLDFVDDCRLVVSELVGNSIRHARPLADGRFELRCDRSNGGVDIAVTDGGAGTRPQRVEAGLTALAGRGLAIVEALSARWWVESDGAGTTVHALLEPARASG